MGLASERSNKWDNAIHAVLFFLAFFFFLTQWAPAHYNYLDIMRRYTPNLIFFFFFRGFGREGVVCFCLVYFHDESVIWDTRMEVTNVLANQFCTHNSTKFFCKLFRRMCSSMCWGTDLHKLEEVIKWTKLRIMVWSRVCVCHCVLLGCNEKEGSPDKNTVTEPIK